MLNNMGHKPGKPPSQSPFKRSTRTGLQEHRPIIPAFRRLKQDHELEASLDYIVRQRGKQKHY